MFGSVPVVVDRENSHRRERYLKHLLYELLLSRIYEKRIEVYGEVPGGCFWIDAQRQNARFEVIFDQLTRIALEEYTVADIGCGYGAMVDYILEKQEISPHSYTGYDISKKLVRICKKKFQRLGANFIVGDSPEVLTDFAVMSGTYNLAVTRNVHQWEAYVLRCLSKIWKKTQKAMVFNLQASRLLEAYISKDKIYYAAVDSLLHKMEHMIASPILVTERSLPRDVTIVIERT